MSFSHWLALAVLAALPLLATAQQPDPAHADVVVPAPAYVSAFKSYRAAADEQESPDKAWRSANDTVARLNGHAGHIESDGTAPAGSVAEPAAHVHHGMHHQSKGQLQ